VVFLQEVPEPVLSGKTNRDLAEWALDLKAALVRSNLDKYHLREWLDGQSPESPHDTPPTAVPPTTPR
jgi:hypothetical protein